MYTPGGRIERRQRCEQVPRTCDGVVLGRLQNSEEARATGAE